MINLAYTQHVKIDLQNFFLPFLTVWTWIKNENLHLTFSQAFCLDRYRDASL